MVTAQRQITLDEFKNLTNEEIALINETINNELDMVRIEEFYREIVSSQNSLYEGHWRVN